MTDHPTELASPQVSLPALLETARTIADKYRPQSHAALNLFRVTPDLLPQAPSAKEVAALDFFAELPNHQLVLPSANPLPIFAAAAAGYAVRLARQAQSRFVVVSDSALAYQLFLTAVATHLAGPSGLSALANRSILAGDHVQRLIGSSAVTVVSRINQESFAKIKRAPQSDTKQLTLTAAETGTLKLVDYYELPELSVAETAAVLAAFAQPYETAHRVRFTQDALAEVAGSARRILTQYPTPERALLVLDELGAEFAPAAGEGVRELDATLVQATLAKRYHTFPDAVLDRGTVLTMEKTLNAQVTAQPAAVAAAAKALARASLGLNDPTKPLASFLFAGPTGVGKTELAKQLALLLYGSETALVRLDMSEYATREDGIYKLIGGAGIWRNSEAGGALTNALDRQPNAIILFDEFEKASPEVQNLTLQMIDEGRLTSGLGKTYDLTRNILIFTSNAGMARQEGSGTAGFGGARADDAKVGDYRFSMEALKTRFSPELLNRFSAVVPFKPLAKASLATIFELKLRRFTELFAQRGIELTVTPAAKARLIDLGYDPAMGARPLTRAIDDELLTPVANLLLQQADVAHVVVDVGNADGLVATSVAQPAASSTSLVAPAILAVNGAFNPKTAQAGYGGVLTVGDKTQVLKGAVADSAVAQLRDIGGELTGVLAGVEAALRQGLTELTVVYSYSGVAAWAVGDWQAKQASTQAYQQAIQALMAQMAITFVPFDAASGARREETKQLAKSAVELG